MNKQQFTYNKNYLIKDGLPWFPMMGELHYSRYPKAFWEESLYKMKAGGLDVISTYAFWLHHEEVKGEMDFSGNKDLRTFVKTCQSCGLYLFLRIGPWCHGEARNGGFPDWLLQEGIPLRTNDPRYFQLVKAYYEKIFEQVKDLLYKDGGPIIGLQIENEYGHVGGLTGKEGDAHMVTLTKIAKDVGFDVPYYTATGWGGAMTGGLIPVMGGYCDAPWDSSLVDIEPSGNFIFTHERNDHNIGSDHGFGTGITFEMEKFPYLTAELGGGLQVTHHRRPVAKGSDIGAMSTVKVGSGVNLLGYYMYHGGTNPKGKLSTLQESTATGYPNDYPVLNYDFHGPIREFGQMSETLKEIKLLAMFIKDFGKDLCRMPATMPEENPLKPGNLDQYRVSYRYNKTSGYVFVNNYQRRREMSNHLGVKLQVSLPQEIITFPEINIEDKDYFFFPFRMKLGKALLMTATATPLCQLKGKKGTTFVFYAKDLPRYDIVGDLGKTKLLTLSRAEALNAWKVSMAEETLIITESSVVQTEKDIQILSRGNAEIWTYPELQTVPEGFVKIGQKQQLTGYKKIHVNKATASYARIMDGAAEKHYEVVLDLPKAIDDAFVIIDYVGDRAELFMNDEMITDHFYLGEVWEIGLKQFNFPEKLILKIYGLSENGPVFLESWPEMKEGMACEVNGVSIETEFCDVLGG